MLTDSQRTAGRPALGTCATCAAPLYAGPLGPAHARHSQDRDHAAVPAK